MYCKSAKEYEREIAELKAELQKAYKNPMMVSTATDNPSNLYELPKLQTKPIDDIVKHDNNIYTSDYDSWDFDTCSD